MKKETEVREVIEKIDVLSEIYSDLGARSYSTKEQRDMAKLKMELIKKEMLLLTYMVNSKVDSFVP
ncbi:MAG: hypothetical protein HGA85_01310 [Nanoarchaeota archaeon]|nr:hypothetical protein [Nanoarchaeota archaeon]